MVGWSVDDRQYVSSGVESARSAPVCLPQAVYLFLQRPSDYHRAGVVQRRAGSHTAPSLSGSCSGGSGAILPKQGRAVAAAVAKPLAVIAVAVWWPLSMGCVPFDRSVVGEVYELLKRPGAGAMERILF